MLLLTLSQISILAGVAFSQEGGLSDDGQGGLSSMTPLAPTQNNFSWMNTSANPAEATIEIQFDGLSGSGVINLTGHAGFTVLNLTATDTAGSSPANITSVNTQTTACNLSTSTTPVNISTITSGPSFTPQPTTPAGSNASMNKVFLSPSPTSANISLFIGVGVLSKASLPNALFLGSLAMFLVG